jgi:small-conductance mechanosensitive channel
VNLLVIAKEEWFKNKSKGIGYETWQGNVFLLVIILIVLTSIFLSTYTKLVGWILCVLFLFLLFDGLHASVKAMDERDRHHYSLAMRNTALAMLITMIVLFMLSGYLILLKNIMWIIYITCAVGFFVAILTKHKIDRVP